MYTSSTRLLQITVPTLQTVVLTDGLQRVGATFSDTLVVQERTFVERSEKLGHTAWQGVTQGGGNLRGRWTRRQNIDIVEQGWFSGLRTVCSWLGLGGGVSLSHWVLGGTW